MIVIGLTGSIGMGKSATAAMFKEEGCPVLDADAQVHAAYAPGGVAVGPLEAAFPGVTTPEGGVDRAKLSDLVVGNPAAMDKLNSVVHPLLRGSRAAFFEAAKAQGADMVVLDIPLLFETGGEARCDKVLVVSAPRRIQLARVMARPGMTAERLAGVEARQMPDAEKRRRADIVIETGLGRRHSLAKLRRELKRLRG